MIVKHPLCKDRIRRIPSQFSWVDHRLVRDKYIQKLTHQAATLYLFLITVGDEQGLSYYGDPLLANLLNMTLETLQQARDNLIRTGLIAWQKPLYQVLALEPLKTFAPQSGPMRLGDILRNALENAS